VPVTSCLVWRQSASAGPGPTRGRPAACRRSAGSTVARPALSRCWAEPRPRWRPAINAGTRPTALDAGNSSTSRSAPAWTQVASYKERLSEPISPHRSQLGEMADNQVGQAVRRVGGAIEGVGGLGGQGLASKSRRPRAGVSGTQRKTGPLGMRDRDCLSKDGQTVQLSWATF
jgi:hypothetical protein